MEIDEAIARAWAATDWGIQPDHVSLDGYIDDVAEFRALLVSLGFDIVPLIPHERPVE